MTESKSAEGLDFLSRLNQVATDKSALIGLARSVIAESHDKRSFIERKEQDLRVNPTSIHLGATIGLGHAITKKKLSTNDKLYMVMHKYITMTVAEGKTSKDKALKRLCQDFAMSYPQEYGVENTPKVAGSNSVNLLKTRLAEHIV